MNLMIEYEPLCNKWIVWEKCGSILIERYISKLKKDCSKYLEREKKR